MELDTEDYFSSFLPYIVPWNFDPEIDILFDKCCYHRLPVFNCNIGIQGMGESFSFILKNSDKWNSSSYLTTIQSLALIVYHFLLIYMQYFFFSLFYKYS